MSNVTLPSMKNWLKVISLCVLNLGSITVWASYFDAKDNYILANYELSDDFWAWEARGRLALIDGVLDFEPSDDLTATAHNLIQIQNTAYDVGITAPQVIFTALRGEANGLYVPADKTIYLNTKMNWNDLPFERFAEVVLHENMHHILTHSNMDRDDFKYLSVVGFHHHDFAMDNKTLNPQEYVAYRTQRAGRYVGLSQRDLSTWETSARTQEIRMIRLKANY